MATKNLSAYNPDNIPDAHKMKFGIVVAEWNNEITGKLLDGAITTLRKHGASKKNIKVIHVPGSFELTSGAKFIAEKHKPDAIICLGCVIQGETPHFTYICQGATQGITQLNLDYNIPFIFGVLTVNTREEASDRAGGKHGNKGDEAAITAIRMAALRK